MVNEDTRVRELEETVRFCYLAENKNLPAKDLLGVISKKVTCIDSQKRRKVYHVVVSISQEDYDRITSREDFREHAMPKGQP